MSEYQSIQRSDVVRAQDANVKSEVIQHGLTRNLLGQWQNKENEEYHVIKRQIVLAEDEGKISENDPIQRSDVVRAQDANVKSEVIQHGLTRNLLGQWQNKENEEYHVIKRQIVLAEDEGKISENDPIQRSDVVRAQDANVKSEVIQLGYTRNLLGQWQNKENEEYHVIKRQIVLAEDEGKISENDPIQRSDVVRAQDANVKSEVITHGLTRNLLGQWQNKENEEYQVIKRQIVLAEDEGKISENDPIQRSDVVRAQDANIKSEVVQLGYTRNLLGQWQNKENEEFKVTKRLIVLAEDEG